MDAHVIHAYHGTMKNRAYVERGDILHENEFNPDSDICYDSQGVLRLTGNKPRLRDDIRAYFRARNEDDLTLGSMDKYLV